MVKTELKFLKKKKKKKRKLQWEKFRNFFGENQTQIYKKSHEKCLVKIKRYTKSTKTLKEKRSEINAKSDKSLQKVASRAKKC